MRGVQRPLLLLLALGSCGRKAPAGELAPADEVAPAGDEITFRGKSFKMKRAYASFDDYKDDPDNLAPGEAARASQLIRSIAVPTSFDGRDALIRGTYDLEFPGYGHAMFGEAAQPDGSVLSMFAVELPQSEQSRYLVFRGRSSTYTLVDDFVESDSKAIARVRDEDGKLVYFTMQNARVMEHEGRRQ
jgi:hypothetical protein